MHIKRDRTRKTITTVLIYLFLLNVVFLPNDTFQLKKISFILLVLVNFDIWFISDKKNFQAITFLFATLLPLYIIIKSSILTGDLMSNFSGGFTGFMLMTYFVVRKCNIDFEIILMRILLALAIFMVSMAILDFLGIIPTMSNKLLLWFYNTDNAMIGRGSAHAFGIIYFMKGSPLLIIAIPYYIKNNKILLSSIILAALLVSGTRANVVIGVLVYLACFVYREKNVRKRMVLIIVMLLIVFATVFSTGIINVLINAFVMKAENDNTRSLSLQSIILGWQRDPISFFLGSGFSSEFFDMGRHELVSTIELSYWNLLRRVGLFVFLLMMYMYILPITKTYKTDPLANIGYIGYLAVAYTNPLLYTTTGITALIYMYYLVDKKRSRLLFGDSKADSSNYA